MRLIYLGLFLSISCSACAQAIRANHAHYKGEEFLSGRWKAKDTRLSFRQYYAPYLVQDRSANRTGSYWQGLVFTRTSPGDRKSTRLNSSHVKISYAVFCL